MKNWFTEHPHSIGETYIEHFKFASRTGLAMVVAGFACISHAFVPAIFSKVATNTINRLSQQLQERKARAREAGGEK